MPVSVRASLITLALGVLLAPAGAAASGLTVVELPAVAGQAAKTVRAPV